MLCPPEWEATEGAAQGGWDGLGAYGGEAHGLQSWLRGIRLEERYGPNAALAAVVQRLPQGLPVSGREEDQAAVGRDSPPRAGLLCRVSRLDNLVRNRQIRADPEVGSGGGLGHGAVTSSGRFA